MTETMRLRRNGVSLQRVSASVYYFGEGCERLLSVHPVGLLLLRWLAVRRPRAWPSAAFSIHAKDGVRIWSFVLRDRRGADAAIRAVDRDKRCRAARSQ